MTKARALAKILKGSTGSRAASSSRSLAEAEPVWYVAGRDEDPNGLIARQPNRERCYGAVTFAVILMAIWFWGVKERARFGFGGISGNDLAPHLKCDAYMPFAGLP
jgi:hypothetical protein